MRVVPTGAVFYAVCELKLDNCAAREGGAVTTVLLSDTLEQVNTCKVCLNNKIREGEWAVEGSRVSNMRESLDLAILDNTGEVIVAVEIKSHIRNQKMRVKKILEGMSLKQSLLGTPYFAYASPNTVAIYERLEDSLHELFISKPDLTLPMFIDAVGDTPSSPLMQAKQHMLLERAFARYFKSDAFLRELPKNLKVVFSENEVFMEYVVKNT